MTCELLEGITINYEDELGTGGYAKVYKGLYENKEIAVKIFKSTAPIFMEHFENERKILQSVGRHRNIVKLLGQYRDSKTGCMALCYEYINNGSLNKHIDDQNIVHDWCTWYAIILGICYGLKHLQQLNPPIFHLDIKPHNILIDRKMVPKLADFGEARSLKDDKTQNTIHYRGTELYRPPEYEHQSKISKTYDIYSLGVVMMKILEGSKAKPETNKGDPETFKERVRAKWRNSTDQATLHNKQVNLCIKIALKCVSTKRSFRPTIEEIINHLNMSEIKDPIPGSWIDQDLLEVYPLQLHFPFQADKVISCTLHLKNKTDHYAAFKCLAETPTCYWNRLRHLNGVLPPRTTYTYVVAMEKHERLPNMDDHSVFLKSRVAEKDTDADEHISDKDTVRGEPTLKTVRESQLIRPRIEIITVRGRDYRIVSIDVHPTEPWILASHVNGNITIWNHQTQERIIELRLINEEDYYEDPSHRIRSAKFIARENWFVAGDGNGFIHVVTYTTMREVKKFKAHEQEVLSLAVHPGEKPLVLSASYEEQIKLWEWGADWNCIRTFKQQSHAVVHVMFNPDGNTFASASLDGKVQIWSTDDPNKKSAILDCDEERQQCVAYFYKDGRQYMISGSLGGATRVWDLQTNKCIKELEVSESEIPSCNIGVVNDLLDNPVLITVSEDDGISFLDTTTYESRFNKVYFGLGAVAGFAYIEVKGKRSLVIAFAHGIAIMEMDEDAMTPLPSKAAAPSGPKDDPEEGRPGKIRRLA